jgi:hypothetical protein
MGRDQWPARELTHLDCGLERLAGEPAFDRFDCVDHMTVGRSGKGPTSAKSLDEGFDPPGASWVPVPRNTRRTGSAGQETCGHQAMSARLRMDTNRAPWRISTSSSAANLTGSGR